MDVVTYDLETTGLGNTARIVQICIQSANESLITKVNPETPIEVGATKVHGITNEMVENCPTLDKIAAKIFGLLNGKVVCGYNIKRFDNQVLRRELTRVGHDLPVFAGEIDVLELNRHFNNHKLETCFKHYTGTPMDPEKAHDAAYDVECTVAVLLKMIEKHDLPGDPMELINSFDFDTPVCGSSWFIWDGTDPEPVFSHGKHAGKRLCDVARGPEKQYVYGWLANLKDLDQATRDLIRFTNSEYHRYAELLQKHHSDRIETKYHLTRAALIGTSNDLEKLKPVLRQAHKWAKEIKYPALLFLVFYYMNKYNLNGFKEIGQLYLESGDRSAASDRRSEKIRSEIT